jgi:hypothetical protein
MSTYWVWRKLCRCGTCDRLKLIKMWFWAIKWQKFSIFPKKKIWIYSSKEFLLSFKDLICPLTGCADKICRKLQMWSLWKVKVDKNEILGHKMTKNLDFSPKNLQYIVARIFAYILGLNMSTKRLWREKLKKVADVVFVKG